MKTILRSTFAVLLAAGSLASIAPAALAQSGTQARAQCDGVQQDRKACLREAGAAAQAARRHGLTSAAPGIYEKNALARCQLQLPDDRAACEARVLGTGKTTIEGSVMGGGLLRETVTPVPASSN